MAEHKTTRAAAHGGARLLDTPLACVVVTPDMTAVDEQADFIALPLYDGEIGIAPGHSPLIGRLGYGEMRIRRGNDTKRYYLDGGFVQVAANVVSVLTGRAIPAAEVDPRIAAERLVTARSRPANTKELLADRDKLMAQARAQLQVAKKA